MSSMILFESLVAGIATLLGAAMVCSFGPVSYTHLDVYKRQVPFAGAAYRLYVTDQPGIVDQMKRK